MLDVIILKDLSSLIKSDLGWVLDDPTPSQKDKCWFIEGESSIICTDCDALYTVYRNQSLGSPTLHSGWAIVCAKCEAIYEIDDFTLEMQSEFASWSLRQGTLQKWTKKQKSAVGFQATDEQSVAMRAALDDVDVVVEALAGTGKTTTMKLIAERKSDERGQYIAFNRAIVEDVKTKIPRSTRASTAHGLAFGAVGHQYSARLNGPRLRHSMIADQLQIEPIGFKIGSDPYRFTSVQVGQLVKASIDNFVQSVSMQIGIDHVVPKIVAENTNPKDRQNIAEHALQYAQELWSQIADVNADLPIEHQHYLKLWQLSEPRINADFILFDEAQDADPVMLDIIRRQNHAQQIYCGDRFQQIYEWRGAVSALESVDVEGRTWLTQSFRFGEAIADWANEILERLDAPHLILGNPNQVSRVQPLRDPEVVLCRTNAGMIQNVIKYQALGKRVAICANDKELLAFFTGCRDLQERGKSNHPELAAFSSWAELLEWVSLHKEEAGSMGPQVTLVKTYTPEFLIRTIKSCVDEASAHVTISTVHRAKGREWNSVQIYSDFPHLNDMDDADLRLMYVALTRGRKTLDISPWETVSLGANKYKVVNSFADLGPIPRLVGPPKKTTAAKKTTPKRSRK